MICLGIEEIHELNWIITFTQLQLTHCYLSDYMNYDLNFGPYITVMQS